MPQSNPPASTAGATASPAAQLVADAIRERRISHGKHVADLLEEHGHAEEAERIRTEVRAQNGHLSAKQAHTLLLAATADQEEA